jgi:hypothetical protein
LSPIAKKIFSIYGKDRSQWQKLLMEESSPNGLTKTYGGTKEAPYEMEHFKKVGYFDCAK